MTTLGRTEPVARVPHNCSLCGRLIGPGEQYLRERFIDTNNGGPVTWKQCAHCRALMRQWDDEIVYDPHEGYGPDDVQEWEASDDDGRQAREGWGRRWRNDAGELLPVPERAT